MLLVVKLPQAGGCAAAAWRKSLRARPPTQAHGARHFFVMCYIRERVCHLLVCHRHMLKLASAAEAPSAKSACHNLQSDLQRVHGRLRHWKEGSKGTFRQGKWLLGRMARCSCHIRVRQLAEVHVPTGLLTRLGGAHVPGADRPRLRDDQAGSVAGRQLLHRREAVRRCFRCPAPAVAKDSSHWGRVRVPYPP